MMSKSGRSYSGTNGKNCLGRFDSLWLGSRSPEIKVARIAPKPLDRFALRGAQSDALRATRSNGVHQARASAPARQASKASPNRAACPT